VQTWVAHGCSKGLLYTYERRGPSEEKNTNRSYNLVFPIDKFPVLIHPEAKFPNKGVQETQNTRRWENCIYMNIYTKKFPLYSSFGIIY
jgi:hypothetical protein